MSIDLMIQVNFKGKNLIGIFILTLTVLHAIDLVAPAFDAVLLALDGEVQQTSIVPEVR